jgi:hypothetical protein
MERDMTSSFNSYSAFGNAGKCAVHSRSFIVKQVLRVAIVVFRYFFFFIHLRLCIQPFNQIRVCGIAISAKKRYNRFP